LRPCGAVGVTLFLLGLSASGADATALTNARVLESFEVDFGPRSVFYNRIETPLLKQQLTHPPVTRAPAEAEPAAEELAAWNAKEDVTMFLSCTVWDNAVTEVRWQREDGEYVFWSGVDFKHLGQAWGLEAESSRFTLILGLGDESSADTGADLPKIPAGSYRIVSFPKTGVAPGVVRALDDLHACYREHAEQFRRAYEAMEAKRLDEEAWRRAHPPVPKDTIINYFPIRSVYTGQATKGPSR